MTPTVKIVTVIQARMGSSRLPGKVLRPLLDRPLLVRLVERVKMARLAGTVVIATTRLREDDAIEGLCRAMAWFCYRGSTADLLDRHYQAGRLFGAGAVVKIPSDVPLIDPRIIDKVLNAYLAEPDAYDYVSNLHPATYPDGNDVEVMSMAALEAAWREGSRDLEREHTTPFLWENPGRFRLHNVAWETGLNCSMTHRWTVDYEEDYQFVRAVYEILYPISPQFSMEEILTLLYLRPDIAALNTKFAGVNWYRHHLADLRTISPAETRIGPGDVS